jgi:hypothetical protein
MVTSPSWRADLRRHDHPAAIRDPGRPGREALLADGSISGAFDREDKLVANVTPDERAAPQGRERA